MALSKKNIDKYITEHYDDLYTVINGMCFKAHLSDYSNDLFSNTYLYVNQPEFSFKNEKELRTTFINYAKKQLIWNKTQLKREINHPNSFLISMDDIMQYYDKPDENIDLDDKIAEHIDYQSKLAAIHLYKQRVDQEDDIVAKGQSKLWTLYFNEGINVDSALADRLGCSKRTAARIIAKFRQEIRKIYLSGATN